MNPNDPQIAKMIETAYGMKVPDSHSGPFCMANCLGIILPEEKEEPVHEYGTFRGIPVRVVHVSDDPEPPTGDQLICQAVISRSLVNPCMN